MEEWFSNCDGWTAKEWFGRARKAVLARNKAVCDGDEVAQEMYDNIFKSSASRLLQDHHEEMELLFKISDQQRNKQNDRNFWHRKTRN